MRGLNTSTSSICLKWRVAICSCRCWERTQNQAMLQASSSPACPPRFCIPADVIESTAPDYETSLFLGSTKTTIPKNCPNSQNQRTAPPQTRSIHDGTFPRQVYRKPNLPTTSL